MSKLVRTETVSSFDSVYAHGYDKAYPSLDLVRLERWFFERKPGKVLDYGCGPGTNGLHLLDLGYQVTFVDVSRQALKKTQAKIAQRPQRKTEARVALIDPNADTLAYADDEFDYLICLSVLSNLETEDRIRWLLREFVRVLKPNGKAIVDINGPDATYVAQGVAIGENTYDTVPSREHGGAPVRMYFSPSGESFAKLVSSVEGLSVVDVGQCTFAYFGHEDTEYIVCAQKAQE